MAWQKYKFTFSIDGVKYKDISGLLIPQNPNLITIRVAGTAQMIRQWIKQKYPNIPLSNYFWVNSSSFANGNSIDIYLNDAPDDIYNTLSTELEKNFEYGTNHYSQQKSSDIRDKTDEGKEINYGSKYVTVNNYPPSAANAPTVDWAVISQATKKVLKSSNPKVSSGGGKNFDRGELISDCAGWEINKKVYTDGRVLYSANKKPNTPKNKTDWNIIKGEVLTETGFSYSKYGNFQKWGQISSEASIIAKLCEILGKYYITNTSTIPPSNTLSYKVGDKFKNSLDTEIPPLFVYTITSIGDVVTYDSYSKLFNKSAVSKRNKSIWEDYLSSGEIVPYVEPTSVALPTPKIKVTDPSEEAEDIAEQFMNVDYNIWNKLNIISGTQLYKSQILQEEYAKLFIEAYNNIIYYYPDITYYQKTIIRDKIENDNYHALNNALSLIGFYWEALAAISVDDYIKNPSSFLNPIYYGYNPFGVKQTAVVTPPPTNANGLNESYKLLPPNPKLEFCEIVNAEGSYEDGVLPIQFQSFTALTKFIADNIKNMPKKGEGYDKYFISYKWKLKSSSQEAARYDIGESDANPFKYSNLWAFYKLRKLCFDAWFKNGFSFGVYETDDWYCTDGIGKDGWELNSVQFMSLLSDMIEYYPKDIKRFDYNTKDERLDRFKEVYPKLFKLFSEQPAAATRESIEAIIKMYEIKAKRGDMAAASIIKMYQVQLKRL